MAKTARRSSAAASLREYRGKRNFSRSPEPAGAARPSRGVRKPSKVRVSRTTEVTKRLYCMQKHLASHLHFDLRLEHNGVLLSWAVPKGPSVNPKDKRLAMKVEDHPLEYGDFEGVIPEGYGAGIVMLWDKGTWTPVPPDTDVNEALRKGELKFELHGVKLKGGFVLVRIRDSLGGSSEYSGGGGGGRTWLLIKHRDQWTAELDVDKAAPLSVKSSGDLEDILAKDKPDIWLSHKPPVRGGETGAMLKRIIDKAIKIKAAKGKRKKVSR